MPLKPTNPTTGVVLAPTEKTLDVYHITSFSVALDPNEPERNSVAVHWAAGCMDGDQYVVGERHQYVINGPELATAMAQICDGSLSIYDNLKHKLWAALQAAGQVPVDADVE